MMHAQSPSGKRWQGKLLQPFLHFHDAIEHTPVRRAQVRKLAPPSVRWACPCTNSLWHYFFSQEYESSLLRIVRRCCPARAMPDRFSNTWFSVYLFLG